MLDVVKLWRFEDVGVEVEVSKRTNDPLRIDIEQDKYTNTKSVLVLDNDINGNEVLSIRIEDCEICIRGHNILKLLDQEIRKWKKWKKENK